MAGKEQKHNLELREDVVLDTHYYEFRPGLAITYNRTLAGAEYLEIGVIGRDGDLDVSLRILATGNFDDEIQKNILNK